MIMPDGTLLNLDNVLKVAVSTTTFTATLVGGGTYTYTAVDDATASRMLLLLQKVAGNPMPAYTDMRSDIVPAVITGYSPNPASIGAGITLQVLGTGFQNNAAKIVFSSLDGSNTVVFEGGASTYISATEYDIAVPNPVAFPPGIYTGGIIWEEGPLAGLTTTQNPNYLELTITA